VGKPDLCDLNEIPVCKQSPHSQTGLVEEIAFKDQGIRPAFFRVSAAWTEKAREEEVREEELLAVLRSCGSRLGSSPPGLSLSTESLPTGRSMARRQK